jgi:DNA-binding transcriptional LysR family regulator
VRSARAYLVQLRRRRQAPRRDRAGPALMPQTLVHGEISGGRLVHVLPQWSTEPWPSHLVYTAHRKSSPKVSEMIPLLEPRLRAVIR